MLILARGPHTAQFVLTWGDHSIYCIIKESLLLIAVLYAWRYN